MCLALPGLVLARIGARAQVDFGGVRREVCLDLVPEAEPGDHVLVHAGFAIQRLSAAEARARLALFDEIDATLAPRVEDEAP